MVPPIGIMEPRRAGGKELAEAASKREGVRIARLEAPNNLESKAPRYLGKRIENHHVFPAMSLSSMAQPSRAINARSQLIAQLHHL